MTRFVDPFNQDPVRDIPKDRFIKLKNNIIHIISDGQFGFYRVHFDKGQVPDYLKGAYTSYETAKSDVLRYLKSKNRYDEIEWPEAPQSR